VLGIVNFEYRNMQYFHYVKAVFVAATLSHAAFAEDTASPPAPSGDSPSVTEEQVLTGRELLDRCAPGEADSEAHKFCMTFMVGLVQTVAVMQQEGEGPALFCIDPNLVSPEDVRGRAVKWMQARPERLNEEAYLLVGEALHQAYPCPVSAEVPG
jgi:hypothetical protein